MPGSQPFVFSQKTISKVSTTLARFASICIQYDVPPSNITVFATEATRTAKNQSALLSEIKAASGLSVQILSPAIESLFGALGARSAFKDVDGLFMDLGGGSVQMTYMNSNEEGYEMGAARSARSMPYGAAKLSAAIEAMGEHDAGKDLKKAMKITFEGMLAAHPSLREQVDSGKGVKVYFCGGGFRGYGSMVMATHDIQPYPIPSIAGFSVSGKVFQDTKKMLRANDTDGKIFGMSKRRRSQFPAIVMVVEALLDAVPKVKEVVFCGGGNRDGTLFAKLPQEARESDPIPLLCASSSAGTTIPSPALANLLANTLPTPPCTPPVPEIFTPSLLLYLLSTAWSNMGCSDSADSADALHNTISGTLGGHPGMTHELRAVIALTLCARWGEDLGPADKTLHKNLKELVGESAVFWCRYVGTVLRFLGRVFPAMPGEQTVKNVS
jgi:retrograde regulation protein 2